MTAAPPWYTNIVALQKRYFDFVDKLAVRGDELVAEAVPQLRELVAQGETEAVGRVTMAVQSQLHGLPDKAQKVFDQQIYEPDCEYDDDSSLFSDFTVACQERAVRLDRLVERWKIQLERAAQPDYEAEHRRIVAEFQALAGTFRCQQCGAQLVVDRIFFIDTYITCGQCQTQSQFSPPVSARSLDLIARPLAEQRHVRFVDANLAVEDQLDALEVRWNELRMPAIFGDQAAKAQLERLHAQMATLLQQADQNTQAYLAAIYTDMKSLVPDKAAHYQKLHDDALRLHQQRAADDQRSLRRKLSEVR